MDLDEMWNEEDDEDFSFDDENESIDEIVSKVFDITDMDNPLLMIAGLLVPPMIVGLIVLLLS